MYNTVKGIAFTVFLLALNAVAQNGSLMMRGGK